MPPLFVFASLSLSPFTFGTKLFYSFFEENMNVANHTVAFTRNFLPLFSSLPLYNFHQCEAALAPPKTMKIFAVFRCIALLLPFAFVKVAARKAFKKCVLEAFYKCAPGCNLREQPDNEKFGKYFRKRMNGCYRKQKNRGAAGKVMHRKTAKIFIVLEGANAASHW